MSGYSFATAPPQLSTFLDRLVTDVRTTLEERLVAIILHGSLSMGSFYPPKSDIDLLILVDDLAEAGRQGIYDALARLQAERPYAGSLEVSVICASDAANPTHPLPFLVHLGDNTTGPQSFVDAAPPLDSDLAGHLMVSKLRGVSLFGPPAGTLIGDLSWADYLTSVRADIEWLLRDEEILATPRYAVLNLCRWAMMRSTTRPIAPSKEEGALWALQHAPRAHQPLIKYAIDVYRSDAPVEGGRQALIMAGAPWDEDALLALRDWARTLL